MKIEVGKFYRDREGRKVRIYAVEDTQFKGIHGAFLNGNMWCSNVWTIHGTDECGYGSFDIAAEWEEPGPKLEAWIREDGVLFFQKPSIDKNTARFETQSKRAPWLDEK